MSFDRRLGASIGALLTMVAGSGAVTAYACSYSPVTFRPASELVPLDGPIVVEVVCQETDFCEKGNISDATVTGPSGPVPGTFELVRSGEPAAFLVFRPSAALEADQGYTVRISEPVLLGGEPQAFEVRADGAFGWTDWGEPSWAFDSVTEDAGERFCCFPAQACFDHCFTEARAVKATLTPALPTAPRYGALSYALRWTEADGSVKRQALQPWLRWSDDGPTHAGLRAVFEQPAERYCATLEARDLASGAMHEFSHCENADPTVSVGTQHEPLFDEARLRDCQAPPGMDSACDPTARQCEPKSAMLHVAWCRANAPACAGGGQRTWVGLCEKHAALCSDVAFNAEDAPPTETREVVQTDRANAQDASAGESEAPSASPAEQGCHVQPARSLDALASYGLLGWIALLVRRRGKHQNEQSELRGAEPVD